jgi:hypothetical protein
LISPHSRTPPLSLGLASTVLGAVGLLLFVLPILAIPISVCGIVAGGCGTVVAIVRRSNDARLAIPGAALCLVALSIDIAIAYAPGGYHVRPAQPSTSSPHLPKPYVPPPAPFHSAHATALLSRPT